MGIGDVFSAVAVVISIISIIISYNLAFLPYMPQISVYILKKIVPGAASRRTDKKYSDISDLSILVENTGLTIMENISVSLQHSPVPAPQNNNAAYPVNLAHIFQTDKLYPLLQEAFVAQLTKKLSVGLLPPKTALSVPYGGTGDGFYHSDRVYARFPRIKNSDINPDTGAPYPHIFDSYKQDMPKIYGALGIAELTQTSQDGEYIWECLYFLKNLNADSVLANGVYSRKWHRPVVGFLDNLRKQDILDESGFKYVHALQTSLNTLCEDFDGVVQKEHLTARNIRHLCGKILKAYEEIFYEGVPLELPQELDVRVDYTDSRTKKQKRLSFKINTFQALTETPRL